MACLAARRPVCSRDRARFTLQRCPLAAGSYQRSRLPMAHRRSFPLGVITCVSIMLSPAGPVGAQTSSIDPSLMAEIRRIRAIDNHSHPPKLVGQGEKDDEFDALPCDPLEPTAAGLTTRPENPQYLAAWKDLWGYRYDDRDSAHVGEVVAAKARARATHGDSYPSWVLGRI